MEVKICTKCKSEKLVNEFHFKNKQLGWRKSACKSCRRSLEKGQAREWQKKNVTRNSENKIRWNKTDKGRAYLRTYMKEYISKRIANDPGFRLNHRMRTAIYKSLRGLKGGQSWQILVGYSKEELKQHLESLFTEDMNWENYGKYWHIDHIKPLCSFPFVTADESFKECWSLQNLRPLKATDNLQKAAKDKLLSTKQSEPLPW